MTILLSAEPDWDPLHGVEQRVVSIFAGLVRDHGLVKLVSLLEERLDLLAGPHALTSEEKQDRYLCRQYFGVYDPGSILQVKFLEYSRTERGRGLDALEWEVDEDELMQELDKIASGSLGYEEQPVLSSPDQKRRLPKTA